MSPTQTIQVRNIVSTREVLDWAAVRTSERTLAATQAIPAQVVALPPHQVRQAARASNQSWLEWLGNQLIAGLWEERYRVAVLALFTRTSPIRVYLCSRSETARYTRVYSRLANAIPEIETGRDVLRGNVLPIVLWEPPSTMVRLWPQPYGRVSDGTPLVIDIALETYLSSPIDPGNLRVLQDDVDQRMEYAIVPGDEHGIFVEGNKQFQYVNRFTTWGHSTTAPAAPASPGETGDPEIDNMLEDFQAWLLKNYGH